MSASPPLTEASAIAVAYALFVSFLVNILLFIVAMFLDAGPAIIILGPILGPIFVEMGVHPVHFAIIMPVNLTEGLAAPPMGLVLFVGTQLCSNRAECLAGVADGGIDIYVPTSGGSPGIFSFEQVRDLPSLMRDDRVAEAVLATATAPRAGLDVV